MTILHLSAVKNWGGGEHHIENLCHELQKSNPEVNSIVLCVKNSMFHKRLEQTDIKFETAPLLFNADIRYALRIIAVCRKYKVDLIHIHDPKAMMLAIMADKFSDLPSFVFSKKTSFPIRQKKSTLFKYNYPKFKKYLCVSETSKNVLAEAVTDSSKMVTVYHGTNISNKSSETPFLLREKFNIDSSKKIIGVIGNHIPAKSLETLVEVANTIINIKKRTDFAFIQIGNFTKITDQLLQLTSKYNLQNDLHFLGYVPKASNFIPQFDALLVTSESEGIPQVIYEGFYYDKPVVSTNVGGIPEIIDDGVNGFLADKYDAEKLSAKLIELFHDKGIADRFIEISHKKLLDNYTTAMMAQKTLEQYKSILKNN